MKVWFKRLVWIVLALGVAALVGYAFVPRPVEVDLARLERGEMRVTVDQDGRTRVKDRYTVAAPLAGRLRRIDLKAGDPVEASRTVLAMIEPLPPTLLDARAVSQTRARISAAESAVSEAGPRIDSLSAELALARIELKRISRLFESQAASSEEMERAQLHVTSRQADLKAAQFARDVATFQLEEARAALAMAEGVSPGDLAAFSVESPIDGVVLRVIQESETMVTPGSALLEVGDVRSLEAVIDVLSRDAVRIRRGANVFLERWGGSEPVAGTVRRIEPSGFTKISALGVEEQRVNVIVDFESPEGLLGDGYRVDARIVVWEGADVLKVPTGALFRHGDKWAVYVVRDNRARLLPVKIGQMNGLEAQVLDGLDPADWVILHPTDNVADGVEVAARQ